MENETPRLAEWRVDALDALRRAPSLFLTMLRGALTLALFVGGAYLIDQHSIYLGVLAVSWSVLRVAASSRRAHVRVAHAFVLDHTIDLNCNATISLSLHMGNIIGHEAVRRLFDHLKQAGRLDESARWEEWRDLLIETYQKRRWESDADATEAMVDKRPLEHVEFRIKGGQVWKNDAICYERGLYHEVFVPHDSLKSRYGLTSDYFGLYIRAFVVNGMLRVQVGRFVPSELEESGTQIEWRGWETVTSFPLLWRPWDHRLPLRLLLMRYPVDDSSSDEHGRRNYRQLRRYQKQLARDAESYSMLACDDDLGDMRLVKDFGERFNGWLKKERFERIFGDHYKNEYLETDLRTFHADYDWSKHLSEFEEANLSP